MSLQISTQITINAPKNEVWKVLTDFNSYPKWNPFIKLIEGNIAVNERFHVNIDGMKFKPKVLCFEKNHKFQWIGHLLFPGLFDGKHTFELIKIDAGTTLFIQREEVKGILIPFFKKKLKTEIINLRVTMARGCDTNAGS